MFTTLYINFSDAQGQITLELVAVSGRNLNSSKLSCMSLLPARAANSAVLGPIWPNFEHVLDVIDVHVTCKHKEDLIIKMKALECSEHFPHYNPMGAIRCHGLI